MTDNNGFAFAYFRKCNDAGSGDYKSLRFPPKVVSALDNSDVWMVFDAAPKYLFHYAYSKGIVGIYLGPTDSFDFRSVLHDRNFKWPIWMRWSTARLIQMLLLAAVSDLVGRYRRPPSEGG